MMNPAQIAETLKAVPDQHLAAAVQGNIPSTPGYLALAEMKRRESLRGGQAMGQAPMTTVAQDQAQAPGIGIQAMQPRGFAGGGVVNGERVYSDAERLPVFTSDSPIMRMLQAFTERNRRMYQEGDLAQKMAPYVPREPQGEMKWHVPQPVAPEYPIPEISVAETPTPATAGAGKPSSGKSSSRTAASIGIKSQVPGATTAPKRADIKFPEPGDLSAQDPNTLMHKIPVSKILEELAKETQVDKEEFKKRRGESKEQALARFGATLASRPGGIGGAFGAATNAAMDYRDAQEKEIRSDEKDAKKAHQGIRLAQAQEEMDRFKKAQDMSKQEYEARVAAYQRKFDMTKAEAEIQVRREQMDTQERIADKGDATQLKVAGIMAAARAASGGGMGDDDYLKELGRLYKDSNVQAENDVKNPARLMKLTKEYGTKDPEVIKRLLAEKYYRDGIRLNPLLAPFANKLPPSTIPQAGTGGVPQPVQAPPGKVIVR
jgi:hypothetical protein